VDLHGQFVEVNGVACKRLGYSREEMLKMTPKDINSEPYALLVDARLAQIQVDGHAMFETEHVSRDGKKIPIELNVRMIEYAGKPALLAVGHDISERKQAEEKLRQSSIRQEAILAAVPDIIMEVNEDKVYTWANPAGFDFFGPDVIGKEAAEYFEGEQDTYDQVDRIFQGDPNLVYVESWQRRQDGQKRLLAWRCMSLKDGEGKVIGAISSARDITEEREAEIALRKSEQKHRDLIQNINDVIYNMDRQGRIGYVSPAVERILGYAPAELVGHDFLDYVAVEDHPTIKTTWADALRGRLYPTEFRMRKRDGNICWVRISNRPTLSDDGQTVGITGSLIDITGRKEDERNLERHRLHLEKLVRETTSQSEETHRQLERVMQAAGEGIFGTDNEGRIVFINDAGARMLGRTPDETVGQKVPEIICAPNGDGSPRDLGDCLVMDTITKGRPHADSSDRFQKKDGSTFSVEFTSSSFGDKDSPAGAVVVFHDITERRRTEEERLRHTEELEKFNRAMIDREKRMIEIKEEVNRLCQELGREPKYPPVWKEPIGPK
jgi:PAS domain S-box-containing protein